MAGGAGRDEGSTRASPRPQGSFPCSLSCRHDAEWAVASEDAGLQPGWQEAAGPRLHRWCLLWSPRAFRGSAQGLSLVPMRKSSYGASWALAGSLSSAGGAREPTPLLRMGLP